MKILKKYDELMQFHGFYPRDSRHENPLEWFHARGVWSVRVIYDNVGNNDENSMLFPKVVRLEIFNKDNKQKDSQLFYTIEDAVLYFYSIGFRIWNNKYKIY